MKEITKQYREIARQNIYGTSTSRMLCYSSFFFIGIGS